MIIYIVQGYFDYINKIANLCVPSEYGKETQIYTGQVYCTMYAKSIFRGAANTYIKKIIIQPKYTTCSIPFPSTRSEILH